jgi:hypothetical protein
MPASACTPTDLDYGMPTLRHTLQHAVFMLQYLQGGDSYSSFDRCRETQMDLRTHASGGQNSPCYELTLQELRIRIVPSISLKRSARHKQAAFRCRTIAEITKQVVTKSLPPFRHIRLTCHCGIAGLNPKHTANRRHTWDRRYVDGCVKLDNSPWGLTTPTAIDAEQNPAMATTREIVP